MINESPIFFINNPGKPTWHTNLPFERQSRDAQQFMIEEAKRIRKGIYVGGVRIHPWLYWHVNFWGIMIDELQEDGSTLPKHSTPKLRDVEWMFQEALFVAEKEKKGVAGGGSRRIAKSAMISSYTAHRGHTIYGGELRVNSVVGGSQADLDQITQYITYGIDNLHPFFRMDRVGKNWDTGVTLGTRNIDNTVDIFSKFTITNVNAGAKSSSQKSAGATPNTFIMDECGKFPCLKTLNVAKYSFATQYGWRTSPLLFGCVCKGTKVYDKNGVLRNIEDITAETGILGYDGENTSVENIPWIQPPKQKLCYRIETSNGKFIECSHDHPLMVSDSKVVFFKKAEELTHDDLLCVYDESNENIYPFEYMCTGKGEYFINKECTHLSFVNITSVENIGEQDIYNLEAGVTHTYITNGFISHNTSGDLTASRDFQRILTNPSEYNMITMNWDWLEKRFKTPTWDRQVFGIFFPGQMSLEGTIPKVRTTLDKFLNIESEELKVIEIYDTPWEDKTKEFLERREKLKKVDITTYNDELMHIPLNPDEMFMELGKNPFPVTEATAHLKRITQSGDVGRICDFIDLGQGNGKVEIVDTNKPIADFPFEGGILDCAIKVFENPPDDNSFDFTYVAGLDHYKHTESTGDSIGALYVYKRKVNINDEFEDSIVCSYVSRPPSMTTFNRKCEMILEAYGAQCLQENADISFQQYLEAKNKDIKLLANGQEIVTRMINSNGKQVNKYGLSPTVKNKEYLLNLVISYCQEDIDTYINDKGEEVRVKGVERIKDVQLLHEIIEYKPGKNVDRIVAFGHALVWARYLDDIRVIPKLKGREPKEMDMEIYTEKRQLLQEKVRSKYGRRNLRRFDPYGLRR